MSVPNEVQVSVFLDCTGGQTMMDVNGTGGWSVVPGILQKGFWPFVTDATDKMQSESICL